MIANEGLKICKVCYKLYDPEVQHAVLSHEHQGQGPDAKTPSDRRGREL